MPKIVSTIGSSNQIEQIISQAKEYIVLVTPYLKISSPLLARICQADRHGIKIILIYGKSELSKDQREKINTLKNLNLYYLNDLHAKCYINESFGLLSSMNLYEYSQINNWELGLSFDVDDIVIRDQLLCEVDLLIDEATSKIKSFDRFELYKKRFNEKLANHLNTHFNTKRFIYEKEEEEYGNEYYEKVTATGFPNKYINFRKDPFGGRMDFDLNYSTQDLKKLKSKLDLSIFEDEYRVYHNQPDCISMYYSINHRDKWDSYTDTFKIEYIVKGIELMFTHINDCLE